MSDVVRYGDFAKDLEKMVRGMCGVHLFDKRRMEDLMGMMGFEESVE